MAFSYCQNFLVSAQYLVNKLMEFDQILHMHGLYEIKVGIVMYQFLQIYNRVMALDYH